MSPVILTLIMVLFMAAFVGVNAFRGWPELSSRQKQSQFIFGVVQLVVGLSLMADGQWTFLAGVFFGIGGLVTFEGLAAKMRRRAKRRAAAADRDEADHREAPRAT